MRNNDTGFDEHVTRAAQAIRKDGIEPLKKAAMDEGLLPKDITVETADSYLTRMWDFKRITGNEPEFREVVGNWARGEAQKSVRKFDQRFAREQDSLQREVDELELKELREETALTDLGELSPEDVLAAVRQLQQPRPKKPETLLSFLKKQGGLVDESKELATLGISNKALVGIVNKRGLDFDTATLKAWEEGFLSEFRQRPEINDLLKAIDDEFNGGALRVRDRDLDVADELEKLAVLERTIDEMGIDIKTFTARQKVTGKQADDLAELRNRVIKLQKGRNKKRVDFLKSKLTESQTIQRIEREGFYDTDNNFNDYVEGVTDDIVQTLTSRGAKSPHMNIKVTKRGPLKERTFNIPDKMVDGSQGGTAFISNDIESIIDRYTRVMGADVELKRRFGSVTMDNQIQAVRDDYLELKKSAKTGKERLKLDNQMNQDIQDIQVTKDLIRGAPTAYTSNPDDAWVRAFQQINNWNYITKLGGVTVSSFPDVARPVMVHGMSRYMDLMGDLATNLEGVKLSAKDAKSSGAIHELILNERLNSMADLTDPYAHGTAFERFSHNATQTFSKATGIVHWNHYWKTTAAVMTQKRILDNAAAGKFSKGEREYLALLGIDSNMIKRIASQYKKHGQELGGVKIASIDKWDDEIARRAYNAAIITDVNRTIVTKGAGDVPLIMNSQAGRTLGQFKTFLMAANQRVMLSGLQQADMAVLNGVLFSITAGMAVYVFKEWDRGVEPDLSLEKLLVEGIDRSGLIPVLMEANNMAEKMGVAGLSRLAGASPASRFAARTMTSSLVGPTGGLIENAAVSTRALATGEINESDVRAMRRLIPFNNLTILRQIFDKAEEGLK
jgi:hypothetical protein